MIASMTGFGMYIFEHTDFLLRAEIKSLNGKGYDLNLRIPSRLMSLEMEIRGLLQSQIARGTASCYIHFQPKNEVFAYKKINPDLALGFLKQARSVTQLAGISDEGLAQAIFSLDEVWQTSQEELNADLKNAVHFCLKEALAKFNEFRFDEGNALGNFFDGALERMIELSAQVPGFAAERIEKQKEKFALQLQNWAQEVSFDKNRMEQELVYYFEKWDVTEEITRLAQHLSYFKDTMHEENAGRKLGFITQEMGREINTIGSKANHAEMQKVVVLMKDELEKIKEQLLNVL